MLLFDVVWKQLKAWSGRLRCPVARFQFCQSVSESVTQSVQSSEPPMPNRANKLLNRLNIDKYKPTVAST